MNPSDSSDSDVPLDEALRKEVQRQEDYYKWVEKNASEALGKNHRAEMEKNFGIARNKHRQRQEEYKAVSKVKRTVGKSSEFFPRIRKEVEETKRRKVHTKQEADSSDEEITIEKRVVEKQRKKKRPRKLSEPVPVKRENAQIPSTTQQTTEPQVKTEKRTSNSPKTQKDKTGREKMVAEQLKKNQERAANVRKEIEKLEKEKAAEMARFDEQIAKQKSLLETIQKFDEKLTKNGFNTPPSKPPKRRRVVSENANSKKASEASKKLAEIVISDEEDDGSKPIWQQNWYK